MNLNSVKRMNWIPTLRSGALAWM